MKHTEKCASKGIIQIDYIVAAAMFIIVFFIVVHSIMTYVQTSESTASIDLITSRAVSLYDIVADGFAPVGWNGTGNATRIGIGTRAYRFVIVINNTQPHYINQSQGVADLTNELVSFRYSDMGFSGIDVNSTYITDGLGEVVYNINSDNITFAASVGANQVRYFTVYFDDDSNFTSRSHTVNGTNTINERILAPEHISVVQYRKVRILNGSNYANLIESAGTGDIFISIADADTGAIFFQWGGDVPRSGNIVSIQRYYTFQNSTAGVRNGKVVVQAW